MENREPGACRGRVLVVDDDEFNRELLRQELIDADFRVETASSGRDALLLARSWGPEVILMDIAMPAMDGIEACRRLKDDPITSLIPVVFLTANRGDEETTVAALAAGGNDFLQKPYSVAILEARIACQITIFRTQVALRRMAMTDELTGAFSRRYLFASLRQQIKQVSRAGPAILAVLAVDVDHFKKINDRLGHVEGDRVLRNVSQILRASCRESDVVARFGGEEFVVLLPNCGPENAVEMAEKIRERIQVETAGDGEITVSVGVSWYVFTAEAPRVDDTNRTIEELLRAADKALYRAKELGRNRVCTMENEQGIAGRDSDE